MPVTAIVVSVLVFLKTRGTEVVQNGKPPTRGFQQCPRIFLEHSGARAES